MELAIAKHCQEYFPDIKQCFARVKDRLASLVNKKQSSILNHFMQGMHDDTLMESEEAAWLNKLHELRMLSPQLADVASRLQATANKMDALADFVELHEDKYARIFTTGPPGLQIDHLEADATSMTPTSHSM